MLAGPSKSVRRFLLWAAPLAWLGCGDGGTDIVLPSLTVTTATTGVDLDADGYRVSVDGTAPQTIGLNATVTLDGLEGGQHTVELSGLALNCSAADNPRTVTVSTGGTATAAFSITCGAGAGSVTVTTATIGPGSDSDGFALIVDGLDRGAIGVNATISLASLTAGIHSVGLTGVAANCVVGGDNPRRVTMASGQVTPVAFTISCTAPPPGSGSVQITTATLGTSLDPDGYTVSLDGGNPQGIGTNGSLTIGSVSPGSHSVQLIGEAPNCTVSGDNPRAVTIGSGQNATIQFAIICGTPVPGTGSIQVTAATSGSALDPNGYTLRIDQSSPQTLTINGSRSVGNLAAGPHTVELGGVAANCTVAGDNPRSVTVAAGQTATIAFAVTCVGTGPSVNLRIAAVYLTQSTQRIDGAVPLVVNRSGFLRIFAVASGANTVSPSVRVRFYRNGALVRTQTIAASGGSTPTQTQEGTLGSSWNLPVDAALIQPGLAVVADVDPDNRIAEADEGDNSFPVSGTPQEFGTRTVPPLRLRFVPVRQGEGAEPGNVTAANKDQMVDLVRRLYPLSSVETEVRSPYTTTSGPLTPNNSNREWNDVLNEIEALRIADPDGAGRTYYGVVKLDYASGTVGNGFIGAPSAMGTDDPGDVRWVLAHELGHTWGRFHSPCGPAGGLDEHDPYPYPDGQIGVYGFDVPAGALKAPTLPDIMGYCSNPWISDHTYQRVLAYRQAHPMASGMVATTEPCVLIWGQIVNGRPVLEPAFGIVTRPSLPDRAGAYSVEGIAADGTSLFRVSFDAAEVADDPRGSRQFAFAVPLDQLNAARLADLRLTAPGGTTSAASLSMARLRTGAAPDSIVARREAGSVALQWNASAHPMIMVRDPDTGEVLSFARGGRARVWTTKASLDLVASDGVRSAVKRVRVTR